MLTKLFTKIPQLKAESRCSCIPCQKKFKPNIYVSKNTQQTSLFVSQVMPERGRLCLSSKIWTDCVKLYARVLPTVFIICNWTRSNRPNQRQMRVAKEEWGLQHPRVPGEQNSQRESWKWGFALRCWNFPVSTWTRPRFKNPQTVTAQGLIEQVALRH